MVSDPEQVLSLQRHRLRVEGVVSLLLIPFHQDGSIDWEAYERYLDWQLSMQPAGIFAVCGSSEMAWLTLDERLELARRAVARSGTTPVFATANLEPDRSQHHDEVARMVDTGVEGIVFVPRSELSSEPECYLHYLKGLIERAQVPVFLYEWPHVENYLLDSDLVAKLAPILSGIKDTTCTLEGIKAKIDVADEMIVYQANTPFLLESMTLGARGYMAITSTCYADLAVSTWTSMVSGDVSRAAMLHRELVFLDNLLVRSYPAVAKHIVANRGVEFGPYTRWPNTFSREFGKAIEVWTSMMPTI